MAAGSTDVRLDYDGKKSEKQILLTPAANCVQLWPGSRLQDEPNLLYYGDNLSFLAALANDGRIRSKVRLVYIDPPYATKSVFQSRNQTDAYMDLMEGAHYLEFLRERLILLRELLAEDGSIYVHLDDNMAFVAKAIMDEVFGRSNFRNWITRKKSNPKNYTRRPPHQPIKDFNLLTEEPYQGELQDLIEQWREWIGEARSPHLSETSPTYSAQPTKKPSPSKARRSQTGNTQTGRVANKWRGHGHC